MREKINQKYNALILGLNKNDRTYQARKEFFENKIEEELDAIGSLEPRKKFHDIHSKIEEAVNSK